MPKQPRPKAPAVGAAVREFDRFIRRFAKRRRVPGLAVLLARHGRPLLNRGYGFRDLETALPVTPRTLFGIASVTKSFTALAVLRLQEDRRLRVDDPVVRHLPEFRTPGPRAGSKIRLEHLLTHSSGLPPLPSLYYATGRSIERDPPYDPRRARTVGIDTAHPPIDTYAGLLGYLATERYRLLAPPGARFSYSNEAFALLGDVIERASGRTYESFLEEEILRPAGMHSTTFDTGIMLRFPEVTTLYSPHWTGHHRGWSASQEWWESTSMRAAGALRTNLEDLGRYLEIFRTGGKVDGERVVAATSLKEMTRPRVAVSPDVFYGFGVTVQPDCPGGPIVHHGGALKGVSSFFLVQAKTGLSSAVLTNLDLIPAGIVCAAGLNLLAGRRPTAPLARIPPRPEPPHPLREYAGWYCSGEGIWCRVRPVRDRLRFDFVGIEFTEKNLRFRPNGGDEFVSGPRGAPDWWAPFQRDRRGRLESVFFGWRILRRRSPTELSRARRGRMVW